MLAKLPAISGDAARGHRKDVCFDPSRVVWLTFFHSAATCLHVPTRLTRESTKHEGRKPRTSERHVVGCCEELAGGAPGECDEPTLLELRVSSSSI